MSRLSWALTASTLLFLGANRSHAQATIRLGGADDATVQTLDFDGQADTQEVAWRGGHYRGGFYGGGRYYGYGRYYGWRGYAGYRPFYYRPYAYWPYYAYRPYRYYGSASYYYNVPAYAPTMTLTTNSYSQAPITPNGLTPERMPPPSSKVKRDDSYRFDANPAQTAPMPIPEKLPAPKIRQKAATVPLEGRLVSLPNSAPKYAYRGYGED